MRFGSLMPLSTLSSATLRPFLSAISLRVSPGWTTTTRSVAAAGSAIAPPAITASRAAMRTRGRRVRCDIWLRLLEEQAAASSQASRHGQGTRGMGIGVLRYPLRGCPERAQGGSGGPMLYCRAVSHVLSACGRATPSHTPADPAVHGARHGRVDQRELRR